MPTLEATRKLTLGVTGRIDIINDGGQVSEPVIEVKDLVAGYLPGVNILNGANLYADKGELIGIIGPNGAGKSTLAQSHFGLVKVREGSIDSER
jgi:ABC-type Mn2+/Zn2+ transport system ATPase subunit